MAKLISEFICDFIHFRVYLHWFTHIAFIRMMHSAESLHNCWYIFYTIKSKQLQVTHQESCLICRSSNFGYFGPICSGFRKIIRQKFDNYKTAAVGTLCAQHKWLSVPLQRKTKIIWLFVCLARTDAFFCNLMNCHFLRKLIHWVQYFRICSRKFRKYNINCMHQRYIYTGCYSIERAPLLLFL